MKTKIMGVITLLVVFVATVCVTDSTANITDVDIVPSMPTPFDAVSIVTYGIEGSGPVLLIDTDFRHDGTLLELDISIAVGFMDVMTPWSHSEDIGILPAGMYYLTVQTFVETTPIYNDTYSMTFEVVPEPTTVLLLGLGGFILRRTKKLQNHLLRMS